MLDPWWYVCAACVVIAALALLAVLVLVIVRRVVDKARPEDLPAVLAGVGEVVASLACFLPWGKVRESSPAEPAAATSEVMTAPVTIVAGQLSAAPAINPLVIPGEVSR